MLNFNEFQEYIKENLVTVLPNELQDAKIELSSTEKNNGLTLNSLIVSKADSNIAPNIYLNRYFQDYENGTDLEDVLANIGIVVCSNINAPDEFKDVAQTVMNFEAIKDKIVMAVINTERNQERLENLPHVEKEDLSIIYKILLSTTNEGNATITIQNNFLTIWGITEAELHAIAMENSKTLLPIVIQPMSEVIKEMLMSDGMPEEIANMMAGEMPDDRQMYVITNSEKINGASAMFYENAFSELAKQIGTDLYILPSSIHECIAISVDMGTPQQLAEMVQDVNASQVAEDELLSNHVYLFNASENTITLAD